MSIGFDTRAAMRAPDVEKAPLWARLIGGGKHWWHGRRSVRTWWGEFTPGLTGIALNIGCHETAHLHIALLLFQVFIRLPFLDKALKTSDNSLDNPRFGFGTSGSSVHLYWGRRTKIVDALWQRRFLFRQFLDHDGIWRDHAERARSWRPGEGVTPLCTELPYHYMLASGEVQHVTATVVRERCWVVWVWFGDGRRHRVSERLRGLQRRLSRPSHSLDITFSDEVGERAGSWKGGCTGCGWTMKPGESAESALRRMQAERKFR